MDCVQLIGLFKSVEFEVGMGKLIEMEKGSFSKVKGPCLTLTS